METALVLLVVVAVVCLGVLAWSGRKRFPLRIGAGNFFRRKTQVAIVVAGLLIGTAIISSSYVIQSTFDYTIRSAVFRALDHTDEIIRSLAPDGSLAAFPARVLDELRANASAMPHVDGLAGRYTLAGAAIDLTSSLFEPSVNVIGFDASGDLGAFVRADGSAWDGSGLGPADVIINERLADGVEARVNDTLLLSLGAPRGPLQLPVRVAAIVRDEGRGAWQDAANVFARLDSVQIALGTPGMINAIHVSNAGGVSEGYLVTDAAIEELEAHLPSTPQFAIVPVKKTQVDNATEGVSQLSQIFILLGTFTIVAGILLIVNIFVMLAEERKGEMGVARALGMRRTNLVQSFVAEGLLYAVLAAAVGTLAGLFLAAVILWAFGWVFPAELFGGVQFVLTWTAADLVQGFSIGFLITMATIGIASWRVSKLNIVRAIRDIAEPVPPRSTRRQLAIGAGSSALGGLLTLLAVVQGNLAFQDIGPSLLALGLAILLMRIVSPRILFTAAGAVILVWVLSPVKFLDYSAAGIELFIEAGMLLVLGGLLVVLFNSDAVLSIATRVLRTRTWRPVVRTAIAYPMNKKFRTGATLASIALVMFTIATMSGIQAMVESSIEETTVRESAGFDLLGTSAFGVPDFPTAWSGYPGRGNVSVVRALSVARAQIGLPSGSVRNTTLLGVPAEWSSPEFEFQSFDPAYGSPAGAWAALGSDPGVAIIDGTAIQGAAFGPGFGGFPAAIGDVLTVRNATGTASVRIIGVLYERFVSGLFLGWDTVRDRFGVDVASLFYFDVVPGLDATAVGHDIERAFLAYGMITLDIHAFVSTILEVITGIFNLLQAYLALGLIVGIAGLGVITMRNVVERRQETGALRALGFRKSMVLRSYLFELSFIALTGIAMGVVLGILLSYDLYLRFFEGQGDFVIPWERLLLLGGIAYLGAVLATSSPAIRASRMPPAEALRAYE